MDSMGGGDQVKLIMSFGMIVIGIFSVIFLFYTNSFLMKRRKKEFGLFNILGMDKGNLAKVIALETLYTALISIAAGLALGVLLSKLMTLVLYRMLDFKVPFGFYVSWQSMLYTAALFAGIFLLIFLNGIRQIHLAKPVELLSGSNAGEKEPRARWLIALLGLACLAAGYYIAIVTKQPLQAMIYFLIAVILVIIGTYLLFVAGSIALLKILRANRNYYYKTKHFTTVSGMIYRMKQNAVGLANICILSTMVLVMFSTTFSMYIGLDDGLRSQYPRNLSVELYSADTDQCDAWRDTADAVAEKQGIEQKNRASLRYAESDVTVKNGRFRVAKQLSYSASDAAMVIFISDDEYNRTQHSDISLAEGEAMIYSPQANFTGKTVSFGDRDFRVRKILKKLNARISVRGNDIINTYYVVLPDDDVLKEVYTSFMNTDWQGFRYYYGFDTGASAAKQIKYADAMSDKMSQMPGAATYGAVNSAEKARSNFLTVYGGLFFLGLFLGILFIMAAILIMYYKQISEGYDDKERFEIMQKVGMSREEVRSSIRSQVLTVFFLPLAVAAVHIAFAFKMITRLLMVLGLTNETLFAWCTAGTIGVFAVLYAIVYILTARVYYRIVR